MGPSGCRWESLQKQQGEERSELGLGPVESELPNRPPNRNVEGAEEVLFKSVGMDSAVVGTSTSQALSKGQLALALTSR